MNATVSRVTILAAVKSAAAVLDKNPGAPIGSAVILRAKDDAITVVGAGKAMCYETSVEANVGHVGGIAINAATLSATLAAASGDVVVLTTTDAGKVAVAIGGGKYNLMVHNVADAVPTLDVEGVGSVVAGSVLADVFEMVAITMAEENNRYGLSGAFLECVRDATRIVSTDGNRMTWRELPVVIDTSGPRGRLVPRAAVPLIIALAEKSGDVTFTRGDRAGCVVSGKTRLAWRNLEADFPSYRDVLPTSHKRMIKVDRDALLGAVTALQPLATSSSRDVRVEITDNSLILYTRTADIGDGRQEVDADVSGEPMKIGMNSVYLSQALKALPSGVVMIRMNGALSPVSITVDGLAAELILMPLRMD